jgi:DNA-binding transcriptional ArsR family regulator
VDLELLQSVVPAHSYIADFLLPGCDVPGPDDGIDKRHSWQQDLSRAGLLLVPSVFTWPNVIFEAGSQGLSSLTYAARGVGKIWGASDTQAPDDALGALLGRSRAAILTCLELPHSTTELALKLGQSPPSISQHLSVLRRSGLVTSWRSGRSVLYRRTTLAGSIVEASGSSAAAG